jgi:CubicO group peptidase (beta-lactamase class C family)
MIAMAAIRSFAWWVLLGTILFASCKRPAVDSAVPTNNSLYFPPTIGAWQTTTPAALGWNSAALNSTFGFLDQKNTKAFIVLKNGELVVEKYFGTFTQDSVWYWASAAKTLTAVLVGIAQQQGKLRLTDRTNRYLGAGFTNAPLAKENAITIFHQLTMTTGLDDGVPNDDCTTPACLLFKADVGTRWAYHNAPYTLLDKVIENATQTNFQTYTRQQVGTPIGMGGLWVNNGFNNVYYSNARSMARFGLLLLAKGQWNGTNIINNTYVDSMATTSNSLNQSYGLLTWLAGKPSYMLPTVQTVFNGSLVPNAPADMLAALGKNDQKIYVVPSKNLVVIRMGNSAGNVQLAASSFDNELWGYLRQVWP